MYVCQQCFEDDELKGFIYANHTEIGNCNFCNHKTETEVLPIEELLDFFSELFSIYEISKDGKKLTDIIQDDWKLFSDSVDQDKLLYVLLSAIPGTLSSKSDTVDYISEIYESEIYWTILKNKIKWEKRFITDNSELEDLERNTLLGDTKYYDPDKLLYRSRIHGHEKIAPFNPKDMKCPPKEFASAGRANPQGIPYLYLSEEPETTLYETRSSYLDEISIAIFKLKNHSSLSIVDFTEKPSVYYHVGNIKEFAKGSLLKRLISSDLSKPIRRYDSELDYIPTQFICEFIRHRIGADGILFESSLHSGGKNLVVFDQNKLECINVYKQHVTKIEIQASTI